MLTPKQQIFYEILHKYFMDHGKSPTLDVLMVLTGQKSKRGVAQYLQALENKGYITKKGVQRSIRLQKRESETICYIPFNGVVRDFI